MNGKGSSSCNLCIQHLHLSLEQCMQLDIRRSGYLLRGAASNKNQLLASSCTFYHAHTHARKLINSNNQAWNTAHQNARRMHTISAAQSRRFFWMLLLLVLVVVAFAQTLPTHRAAIAPICIKPYLMRMHAPAHARACWRFCLFRKRVWFDYII